MLKIVFLRDVFFLVRVCFGLGFDFEINVLIVRFRVLFFMDFCSVRGVVVLQMLRLCFCVMFFFFFCFVVNVLVCVI